MIQIYIIFILLVILTIYDKTEVSIAISLYFLYKWVTNSTTCTISYVECKVRGVKKEGGYIYQFITPIMTLNKSQYFAIYLIFILLILFINCSKKIKYKRFQN